MRIKIISDLHGFLPKIEPCDLLLIGGDIVDLKYQASFSKCRKWYLTAFKPWAEALPCSKVLFIFGNHECGCESHEAYFKQIFSNSNKVTLLDHELYDYEGVKIFGTPYCKVFGNWAYNCSDKVLTELFSKIPENLDILLSHDAPYNCTDRCIEGWNKEPLGSKPLRDIIIKQQPKYALHGHLHSSTHEFELLGETKCCNCSYVNEDYIPTWDPITIEL